MQRSGLLKDASLKQSLTSEIQYCRCCQPDCLQIKLKSESTKELRYSIFNLNLRCLVSLCSNYANIPHITCIMEILHCFKKEIKRMRAKCTYREVTNTDRFRAKRRQTYHRIETENVSRTPILPLYFLRADPTNGTNKIPSFPDACKEGIDSLLSFTRSFSPRDKYPSRFDASADRSLSSQFENGRRSSRQEHFASLALIFANEISELHGIRLFRNGVRG